MMREIFLRFWGRSWHSRQKVVFMVIAHYAALEGALLCVLGNKRKE